MYPQKAGPMDQSEYWASALKCFKAKSCPLMEWADSKGGEFTFSEACKQDHDDHHR